MQIFVVERSKEYFILARNGFVKFPFKFINKLKFIIFIPYF